MAKIKVTAGARVLAEFADHYDRQAREFAREVSRGNLWCDLLLTGAGMGSGIVGQYCRGKVSAEFKAHDRGAGLRTPVMP